MHHAETIYNNLGDTLLEINKQIDQVTKDAEHYIAGLPYPKETTVYMIKDTSGRPVLTDLLMAKANCLSAMARLKVAER